MNTHPKVAVKVAMLCKEWKPRKDFGSVPNVNEERPVWINTWALVAAIAVVPVRRTSWRVRENQNTFVFVMGCCDLIVRGTDAFFLVWIYSFFVYFVVVGCCHQIGNLQAWKVEDWSVRIKWMWWTRDMVLNIILAKDQDIKKINTVRVIDYST